jgi:hypothetical protein
VIRAVEFLFGFIAGGRAGQPHAITATREEGAKEFAIMYREGKCHCLPKKKSRRSVLSWPGSTVGGFGSSSRWLAGAGALFDFS